MTRVLLKGLQTEEIFFYYFLHLFFLAKMRLTEGIKKNIKKKRFDSCIIIKNSPTFATAKHR